MASGSPADDFIIQPIFLPASNPRSSPIRETFWEGLAILAASTTPDAFSPRFDRSARPRQSAFESPGWGFRKSSRRSIGQFGRGSARVFVGSPNEGGGAMPTKTATAGFRRAEGVGIGLAISRTIAESHSGQLLATPNSLEGAVFQFALRADDKQKSSSKSTQSLIAAPGLVS